MSDTINRQDAIDARKYTFGNDEFSLEAAYHDCKLVFDGITDDDSFQEADTGLILYYANEIIYALQEALEDKDANVPSNETISRQAVIDMVKGWNLNQHILNEEDALDDVKALPSVESERKKGEWINKEFYGIGEGSAECSICHKRSSGYKEDDGWSVHCLFHDFCPKCGEDMRGK